MYGFPKTTNRFSRPVLSTAQSPIRLIGLLCTLGQGIWQENFELFNLGIYVYIFYILYEKVATAFTKINN